MTIPTNQKTFGNCKAEFTGESAISPIKYIFLSIHKAYERHSFGSDAALRNRN